MEIRQESFVEQDSVGEFQEIASTIRTEDLGIMFDMVSKNLYSNPIGSFVRELVSNAVDANTDNDKSTHVRVDIYNEEGTWYFKVADEGKGMNAEHFSNVYMKWFNSDKRNTNDKIGGWGLGSKSPLSYVEQYEITTIADGIEYNYIIVRQNPVPTATLISSNPTDKPSGTVVKVEIQSKDLIKVSEACDTQLLYFDNVYVVNDYYYYKNDFTIIEHSLFKVRNDGVYPYGQEMHIVLGNVAYPLNWAFLGIRPINIPVGIKFPIGSLPVTLSREEIAYEDNIKDFILSKIDLVYKVLLDKYEESVTVDSFLKYFEITRDQQIRKTLKLAPGCTVPFSTRDGNKLHPIFKLKDVTLKLPRTFLDDFVFNMVSKTNINTKVNNGKTKAFVGNSLVIMSYKDLLEPLLLIRREDYNHWYSLYHAGRTVLSFKRRHKQVYRLLRDLLQTSGGFVYKNRNTNVTPIGLSRLTYEFIKAFKTEIYNSFEAYESVPENYIKEKKREQYDLLEERKGVITSYSVGNNMTSHKINTLLDTHTYIFYISKGADSKEKAEYQCLFDTMPDYLQNVKYKYLILSDTTIRKVKKHKQFKEVHNIWRVVDLFPYFHSIRINSTLYTLYSCNQVIRDVSSYYSKIYNTVKRRVPRISLIKKYHTAAGEGTNKLLEAHVINLYDTFKDKIEAIGRRRNEETEMLVKILEKVQVPLIYLAENVRLVRPAKDHYSYFIIKNIIKQYKLTKLNNYYYGNS